MEFNDSQFTVEKTLSQEDKRALHTMEQSVRLRDGHYEAALPWKVFPPNLPNNNMKAEQRLLSLKKRLVRDPELHQKYSAFMEDLLEKGYARRVPEDQENKPSWYLPHHPVIHPHKPSKVRVVFDCAVRFQSASLNERILQGPDLTNTLIGVLSRFRQESTAVMADVEQMFYQVLVPVEDCNFLHYLWWPGGDFESVPREFQMRVHVFGSLVPRPVRAIRVTRGGLEPSAIARGLAKNGKKVPDRREKVPDDFSTKILCFLRRSRNISGS